jgi:hypothetical protein
VFVLDDNGKLWEVNGVLIRFLGQTVSCLWLFPVYRCLTLVISILSSAGMCLALVEMVSSQLSSDLLNYIIVGLPCNQASE